MTNEKKLINTLQSTCCPFCKCRYLKLHTTKEDTFQVMCTRCKSRGPTFSDQQRAAHAFMHRSVDLNPQTNN